MKPCWRDVGLTENGAALADAALPAVQALVEAHGGEIVKLALAEATFRHHVLPMRPDAYRQKYLKDNE